MHKLLLFTLFLLQATLTIAQKSITLQQCISQAERNSPQIGLMPLIDNATKLQVELLKKNYLPQTSAMAQSTWQSATTNVPIELPGIEIAKLSKFQYKATIDVTQSIWDGGVTKQQQRIAQAAANNDLEKVKTDLYTLREQVSTLFFGVVLADKQIENTRLVRKDLENKRERTKNLKANGMATGTQILAIEARLIELEQQVNEAESRRNSAVEALTILTGNKNIASSVFAIDNIISNIDTAQIKRPELAYFKAQQLAIEANEKLIKAKNMPKIGAFATAGVGRPSLNMLSNDLQPYFITGIQVRMPLTQFYTKSENIERQQLYINQQKIKQMEQNFLWLMRIKSASQLEDIKRFDKILANDKKLIAIRQEMLATADVQLQNGIISTNDYLTEVNNLDLARQNMAIHEVQQSQAINNLKITLGQ